MSSRRWRHGRAIAAMTAASMRGEVDFAASLRARIAMLQGQPAALLERVKDLVELTPGARALVRTMKAHGAHTALVSGGFDCFAAIVAKICGFDEYHANRLVIAGGKITGQIAEPILDRDGKANMLKRLAANRGIALESLRQSATAPMTLRCFKLQASASPFTESPRLPPPRVTSWSIPI